MQEWQAGVPAPLSRQECLPPYMCKPANYQPPALIELLFDKLIASPGQFHAFIIMPGLVWRNPGLGQGSLTLWSRALPLREHVRMYF